MLMKNYTLLVLFISIVFLSFGRTPKKIEIKGIIENAEGKTLYLNAFVNNTPVVIDSIVLKKNGKFKLSANVVKPEFFSLGFDQKDYALLVLDSANTNDAIEFNANSASFMNSYTISGSKDSEIVKDLVNNLTEYQKSKEEFSKNLRNPKYTPQQQMKLRTQLDSIDKSFIYKRDLFINENYKSLAVITVLGYLNPQTDIALYKKIESGLAESVPNTEYHIAVLTQIKQIETQIKIKEEQEKERLELDRKTAIGAVAPELNFPSPDGKVITIESLRGNYVLIDFWASWCRPCRAENPNVVKLYNKYKDKGFTVYSVSLDKDKARWEGAIKQDNLAWPNHVSDLKQWKSESVKIYGFRGIPFTVLIDKDGKIIAKNLRGPALEAKLKELLGE